MRNRLRAPDGSFATQEEIDVLRNIRPDIAKKYNKYGYEESGPLDNFMSGINRGISDYTESADYLGNLALEQAPKFKGSGRADAVGAANNEREQEYQKMTEGSIAAGAGRMVANIIPGFLPMAGPARLASAAAKVLPKLGNAKTLQVAGESLKKFSNNSARAKQALIETINADPLLSTAKKGVVGLGKATVNNPRWYVSAPSKGVAGYLSTNSKDAESVSPENIGLYGGLAGGVAGGLGRMIAGPQLLQNPDKLAYNSQAVKEGFSIPPSSMVHAPIGRIMEAFASNSALKSELAIKNTNNAHRLARQDIGLPVNTNPITKAEFAMAEAQPASVYDSIKSMKLRGKPDKKVQQNLLKEYVIDKERFRAGDPKVGDILKNAYSKASYPISKLMDDIRDSGDLVKQFKKEGDTKSSDLMSDIKKSIEDTVYSRLDRHSPGKAAEYKSARRTFAKIHELEEAISKEKLSGPKLAAARKRANMNAYTGGLKSIADFANKHPSVAFTEADSPNFPRLMTGALGAGGMYLNPTYGVLAAALPYAAQKFLSSRLYQHLATDPKLNKISEAIGYPLQGQMMPGYWAGALERKNDK